MSKTQTQPAAAHQPNSTASVKVNGKDYFSTPFGEYFNLLSDIDKGQRDSKDFGSLLILGLVEEIGEMARAYLAKHGRKSSNLAAQADETYQQELGDIMVVILRLARVKKIDLHERVMYSLNKIKQRKTQPKTKS